MLRSSTTVPVSVRAASVALVCVVAAGVVLVLGLAGLPNLQSALASQLPWDKQLTPLGAGDSFGSDVSISGDIAIVGGFIDDAAGTDAGAAFVFDRNHFVPGQWAQVKKLTASDAEAGDQFGYSVAVSGDLAVVGMWDRLGPNPGAAYVYQQDHGGIDNWGEVKKITPSDIQTGDEFGISVAVSGDTIVVGARYQDGAASNGGAAYIFQRDQGGADNWGEVKKLTASDAESNDVFGASVAVSGNTVVVGTPGEDDFGFSAGAAYVFQRDQGGADNWGAVKKLTASNAEAFDNFGSEVAVSGDIVVVGISDSRAPETGEVYFFERDQGGTDSWGQQRRLTAPDNNQWFGQFLALSGSTAVVHDAGFARVLRQHAGGLNNWGEIAQLSASFRLSIDGGTVLTADGLNGYIYELPPKFTPTPCAPEGCPTPTATVTPTFTPAPPPGVRKLVALDAIDYGDFSDLSIAVDGDTAALPGRNGTGASPGHVYIFARDHGGASNWGEIKKIVSPSSEYGNFGRVISLSGDTLVVGASAEPGPGSPSVNYGAVINYGAVYIFERDAGGAGNWGQVARLEASDARSGHRFGHKVSISGDVVIVGVPHDDAGGETAGAVYVFYRNQGGPDNWGQVKKLTASDATPHDDFGWDVAVSGDAAIVGGRRDDQWDDVPAGPGVAYVFERNAGGPDNWGEVKQLTEGTTGFYGHNVAISGDTAIVGKSGASGRAYVYERYKGGKSNWGLVAELSQSQPGLRFGSGIAIDGVTAVIGAKGSSTGTRREGNAYVFQRDAGGAGTWGEVAYLTAYDAEVDDEFGDSVAVSGNTVVVGAHLEDEGATNAGAAYVFDLTLPQPTPTDTPTPTITPTRTVTPTPTSTPTPEPDTDGDGCSDPRESGPDEMLGGRRDWQNQWDFYDVAVGGGAPGQDGQIDLFNDVVSVMEHYAPVGTESEYDAWYDRGPSTGPMPWNMTAPDGRIDLFNDIVGVVAQAFHDCR